MLTERWNVIRLAEVVTDRKEWICLEDGSEYVRISARIRNQGIELRDRTKGALIKTKRQQLVRASDFLVAEIDAKVGGMGIVPSHLDGGIVSSHYFVFQINSSLVDPVWLSQLTRVGHFQEQVSAVGSTNYASIRRHHVHDFLLPLPPLPEQKKIAAILSSVDETIAKTESVIAQLQIVKKAMMEQLLTKGMPGRHTRFKQTEIGEIPEEWEVVGVCGIPAVDRPTVQTGPFGAQLGNEDFQQSGVPILRIGNVRWGSIDRTPSPSPVVI